MIARIWHGETATSDADRYFDFLKQRSIPDYRSVSGNRGVYLMRRIAADRTHFLTVSLWDSLQSIRAFAGDDVERAKYYPEDRDFLLAFEPTVQHWETFAAVSE